MLTKGSASNEIDKAQLLKLTSVRANRLKERISDSKDAANIDSAKSNEELETGYESGEETNCREEGVVEVDRLDDCHIFLLQTAYRSLMNFFGLVNIAYNPETQRIIETLVDAAESLDGEKESTQELLGKHAQGRGTENRGSHVGSADDEDCEGDGDESSGNEGDGNDDQSALLTLSTPAKGTSPNSQFSTSSNKRKKKHQRSRKHRSSLDFFSITGLTSTVFKDLAEESKYIRGGVRPLSGSWRNILLPSTGSHGKEHSKDDFYEIDEDIHEEEKTSKSGLSNAVGVFAAMKNNLREEAVAERSQSSLQPAKQREAQQSIKKRRKALEASLVEELMSTQYELQKTKLRMNVIEMIQVEQFHFDDTYIF